MSRRVRNAFARVRLAGVLGAAEVPPPPPDPEETFHALSAIDGAKATSSSGEHARQVT